MLPIQVSGESASLKSLLTFCLEHSPWLHWEPKCLRIDWNTYAQVAGFEQDQAHLSVLEELLPALPLTELFDILKPHQSLSRGFQLRCERSAKPEVLPTPVIEALESAAAALGQVISDIAVVLQLKGLTPRRRESLNTYNLRLVRLQALGSLARIHPKVGFCYDFGRRLALAQGDLEILLLGSNQTGSRSSNESSLRRRQVSWRLTRRLIKTQLAMYDAVETLTLDHSTQDERQILDLCRRMAAIEQQLTCQINRGTSSYRQEESKGFMSAKLHLEFLLRQEHGKPQIQSSPLHQTGIYSKEVGPFADILHACRVGCDWLQQVRVEMHQKRFQDGLDRAHQLMEQAYQIVDREGRKVSIHPTLSIQTKVIEQTFHRLIAETPLLTLFASGFLTLYERASESSSFGVGLSPWLCCSVLARKQFGTQPLTFLGPSGLLEDDDAEVEEAPEEAVQETEPMTGRLIWERFERR